MGLFCKKLDIESRTLLNEFVSSTQCTQATQAHQAICRNADDEPKRDLVLNKIQLMYSTIAPLRKHSILIHMKQ